MKVERVKWGGRGTFCRHSPLLVYGTSVLAVTALLIGVTGCASLSSVEKRADADGATGTVLIEGVPFFPQEKHYCGPASLAAVMSYYGFTVSQEEVAEETYLPNLQGTLPLDLLLYAKERNFQTTSYRGDMDDVKKQLALGRPVILFLNLGLSIAPKGHYIVAIGYDESSSSIIAHSGRKRAVPITYKKLERSWSKTGYTTLLILPGEE